MPDRSPRFRQASLPNDSAHYHNVSVLDSDGYRDKCRFMTKLTAAGLRAARGILNWSQADVVKAAGVSPNTVAKIEAGGEVRVATATRIIEAFASHNVEILNGEAPGARVKQTG